jgi:hypothetical protein
MSDSDPLSPLQVTFYATSDLKQRIRDQARRERMSASCWLRRVVDDQLQLVEPINNEDGGEPRQPGRAAS